MNEFEKIGIRIKNIRNMFGLSQAAFAKRIGVSSGNVGDWENSNKKATPGAKALIAISEEFDLTTDWILRGEAMSAQYVQYKNPIKIYQNISEVLNKRGLTLYDLKDFEEKTKLPLETVAMWGFGKGDPSNISLTNIANYLNVPLKWILKDYKPSTDFELNYKEGLELFEGEKEKNIDPKDIYYRIQSLVKEYGISLNTLSAEADVPVSTINELKNGNSHPDYRMLVNIAAYFGISIELLAYGEEYSLINHNEDNYEDADKDKPEQGIELVSEYLRLIQDPVKHESNKDNASPNGQNLIDIYKKKQDNQNHADEYEVSTYEKHISGTEKKVLHLYKKLSIRDKREVEQIIKLKLKLDQEYE